jgi:malate dehydrogenase
LISDLSLYDIQHTKGVGADLSHIETRAKVKAFVGKDELANALKGIDLVVIPAGVPRKPGTLLFYKRKKPICSLRYDTR